MSFSLNLLHVYIIITYFMSISTLCLWVDRERWWFEHSVSQLRVCLSAEGAKKVSWLWLSPLRGWGSLKFVYTYMYIYSCPVGVTFLYRMFNYRALHKLIDLCRFIDNLQPTNFNVKLLPCYGIFLTSLSLTSSL